MAGEVRFRSIKSEIRVLGLSHQVQDPKDRGRIFVGVVYRGSSWLDGVMWTKIQVGGKDATERVVTMITGSPHHKQLRVIVMERSTVARSNLLNLEELFKSTGLPVITLKKRCTRGKIVRQIMTVGISEDDAVRILEVSSTDGMTPEALRVANVVVERLKGFASKKE